MRAFLFLPVIVIGLLAACSSKEGTDEAEAQKNAENEAGATLNEASEAPDTEMIEEDGMAKDAERAAYQQKNADFLVENGKKEGWVTLESGLQYKVIEAGDGASPTVNEFVVVDYEGRLIDGSVFDSSYERGEPATFPAGGLIKGWVEALPLMKKGAVWELAIPANLAYGERDSETIPAQSTLLFKVALHDIKTRKGIEDEMKAPQLAFLEENKKKEGITVTASGLQYQVLTEGVGRSPSPENRVKVHYAGRLIDGSEFDSSYSRGEPIVFGVTEVIPGWTEALQLMKEGAKWQITLPHEIAYGARGAGRAVPPFATLIFDVELIEVLD